MSAFVGTRDNLDANQLREILDNLKIAKTYYFLRWANRVSGIIDELTDFPSPEGQMFNEDLELRWKQKGEVYEALLLSSVNDDYLDFEPLAQAWETEDCGAYFYPETETRFPKGFNYPKELNIAQRYFKDKHTATVHFVALTIK